LLTTKRGDQWQAMRPSVLTPNSIALFEAVPPGVREKKAWGLLSMIVGAVLIARAMPDKNQAAKAIDSALESALDSVGS